MAQKSWSSWSKRHRQRRCAARGRSTQSAGGVRPGAVAGLSLEGLEQRQMLSVTPSLADDVGYVTATSAWFQSIAPHIRPPAIVSAGFSTAPIVPEPAGQAAVQGEWIVRLSKTTLETVRTVAEAAAYLNDRNLGLEVVRGLGLPGQLLVRADAADAAVRSYLQGVRGVAYTEPNRIIRQDALPNDPRYGELYGLDNTGQTGGTPGADIDAPAAWRYTTGSSSVVVAVIDSGIDYTHQDLVGNIWTNTGETPGNGLDDDENGFVDDVHGYDFVNNDGDPMDDDGHGTHVAGTIGAVGDNGIGVVGVAWQVSLMGLKFLNAYGTGEMANAIAAVNYATMMKTIYDVNVRVTNNSWGGEWVPDDGLLDAINAGGDAGILFVAAAGNDTKDLDQLFDYPSSYESSAIVSVAATNDADGIALFSNIGLKTVDLAAPGANILSTLPGNRYGTLSGTSMAAPHVAGAAALAAVLVPDLSVAQLKSLLLDTVDPLPALNGLMVTGGRLNAGRAVQAAGLAPIATTPASDEVVSSPPSVFTVTFNDPFDPATVEAEDFTVNGVPAETFSILSDTSIEFGFTTSPVTSQGRQTIGMAGGALARSSDLAPSLPFTTGFRYDALVMSVVSTTPADASTVSAPLTFIEFFLNEAFDPSSAGVDDLILSSGTVTGVSVIAADRVRYSLAGVPDEGPLEYTLRAGALVDEFGNRSQPQTSTVMLDVVAVPFPAPLEPLGPLGSLAYGGARTGFLSESVDEDSFTIPLDAGQVLAIVATAASGAAVGLRVRVQDPTGAVVAESESAAIGSDVTLRLIPVVSAGEWTVTMSRLDDGVAEPSVSGAVKYSLQLFLNASLESESPSGPTNDDEAGAEPLDPAFVVLGSAAVVTLVGQSTPAGGPSATDDDWYSLTLDAGSTVSAVVAETPVNVTLSIRDAAGNLLARGGPAVGFDAVLGPVLASVTGTYFLVVSAAGSGAYTLVVTRNAALEDQYNDSSDAAQPLAGSAEQGYAAFGHVATLPGAAVGPLQAAAPLPGSGSTPSPVWFQSLRPATGQTAGQTAGRSGGQGEWIVQLSATTLETVRTVAGAAAYLNDKNLGLEVVRGLGLPGQLLVRAGSADAEVRNHFSGIRGVAYAEPNRLVGRATVASDPRYGELYGLDNTGQTGGTPDADIDAPEAWQYTTGSRSVVVAVIDSGIDYTHQDLVGNIWTNPGEIADDGIDNDGNGFVDDVHGYDFVYDDGDPMDDDGHGTHVAGTIGAVGGNGVGIAGVAWQVSLMGLKFLDAVGSGESANAIRAVNYATMMRSMYGVNVRVTNNSWGGGTFDHALLDAINAGGDKGILFVAAAGNNNRDNDALPVYPATYDSPFVVSVAATDDADLLADSYSNYGATTVDLAAPGDDILSTLPGNRYGTKSGTSMAAPQVAGVAALALARAPNLDVADLKALLLDNVDQLPSLAGKTVTGGRLNAEKVVRSLDTEDYYSVPVTAGDLLEITTLTPGDGPGEFVNLLDPQVELFAPDGTLVDFDDNSADDGRNVLIRHAADQTGLYRVRVTAAAGTGEYLLGVTGATGAPAAFAVVAHTPADGLVFKAAPQVTLTFGSSLLFSSVDATDLLIDGEPATGVTIVGDRMLTFTLPALFTDGPYTVELAAGAVQSVAGSPNEAFTSGFTLDLTPPTLVESSLAPGTVLSGSGLSVPITLTFSELLDASLIDKNDFSLSGTLPGTTARPVAVAVTTDASDRTVVTLTFAAVPEDAYVLYAYASANGLRDLVGNLLDGDGSGTAGGHLQIPFSVDGDATLLGGLATVAPLGGLVYRSATAHQTVIGAVDDVDEVFIEIGSGVTTIAAIIETSLSFWASVSVLDPYGEPLGTFTAAGPGQPIVIAPLAVTTGGGACTLRFSGVAGTTGIASTTVTLGADVEAESSGGASNDLPAAAQQLGTSLVTVGSAARVAVVGRISPSASSHVTEGFESGSLGGAWTTYASDPYGRVRVSSEEPAAAGDFLLVMDSDLDAEDRGLVEAVLNVDLSGLTGVSLGFSHRNFGDQDNPFTGEFTGHSQADGVAISADGVNWSPIWDATGDEASWGRHTLDLSAAAAEAGITLGADFRIKFQYYGLGTFPFGGRGWDDIVVGVASGSDTDHYAIDLTGHQSASFALAGAAAAGLTLKVFNPTGAAVASGIRTADLQAAINGLRPLVAGSYRVEVQGTKASDYCLVVVVDGRFEIETNVPAKAQAVSAGDTVLGHLGRPGAADSPAATPDVDVYSIRLAAGQYLIVETLTPAGDISSLRDSPDMKLDVFNPSGSLLADADSGGADGRNARIVVAAPTSGTYTIAASSWGDGSGTYALTVRTAFNQGPTALSLLNPESPSAPITALPENTATSNRIALARLEVVDDGFGSNTIGIVAGPSAALFEIDGGLLFLKAGVALDHEAKASLSIVIRARDPGLLRSKPVDVPFSLSITNVNETPQDIRLSARSIAENNTAGAVVGVLSTVDPDAGDTFTYTLVAGTGDTGNAAFTVSAGKLQAVRPLSFEFQASYSVRVQSTDAGGLSVVKVFTIIVIDRPETAAVEFITPPAAGLYGTGSALRFTLVATQPMMVKGGPTIGLLIDGAPRTATYESGSGTRKLTFVYVVGAADSTLRDGGVTLARSMAMISRNGSVRDPQGGVFPTALPAVIMSGVRVDTSAPRPTSATQLFANATYTAGQKLMFAVGFSEAVRVTGVPVIEILVGNAKRQARYVSGSGGSVLLFEYTVLPRDTVAGGPKLSRTISLPSGASIKDVAGNASILALPALGRSGQPASQVGIPAFVLELERRVQRGQ
jgi:subtilisin family serine protease